MFSGISFTTLSSSTVSVMSYTFCMSGAFPVGFPTVLASFPDAVVPSSTCSQPLVIGLHTSIHLVIFHYTVGQKTALMFVHFGMIGIS